MSVNAIEFASSALQGKLGSENHAAAWNNTKLTSGKAQVIEAPSFASIQEGKILVAANGGPPATGLGIPSAASQSAAKKEVSQTLAYIRKEMKADKWFDLDKNIQARIVSKLNSAQDKPAMAKALAHSRWGSNESIEDQLYDKTGGRYDRAIQSFMKQHFYTVSSKLTIPQRLREISEATRSGLQSSNAQRQRLAKLVTSTAVGQQPTIIGQLGWQGFKQALQFAGNVRSVAQIGVNNIAAFPSTAEVASAATQLGQINTAGLVSLMSQLETTRGPQFKAQVAAALDYSSLAFVYYEPKVSGSRISDLSRTVGRLTQLARDPRARQALADGHWAELQTLRGALPPAQFGALAQAFDKHHSATFFGARAQEAVGNLVGLMRKTASNRLTQDVRFNEGYYGPIDHYTFPNMDKTLYFQLVTAEKRGGGISTSSLNGILFTHAGNGGGWYAAQRQAILRAISSLDWQDLQALESAMNISNRRVAPKPQPGNGGPPTGHSNDTGSNGGPPSGRSTQSDSSNGGPPSGRSNGGPPR